MKLMVKKIFFDQIKAGMKHVDYRDAHITFTCEETGEILRKKVINAELFNKEYLPSAIRNNTKLFTDDVQIHFVLEQDST